MIDYIFRSGILPHVALFGYSLNRGKSILQHLQGGKLFLLTMLPDRHQKKMRTSNSIERTVQQEVKRRTRLVRALPNREVLLQLVSAILIEIHDEWATANHRHIAWNNCDSTC